MANTLNGMVVDQLLTRGLSAFTQALTPLRVFSLDFSEGIASEGTTVKSRIIGTATAEDLSSDLSGDYEGGTYNTSTTEVSVTLNKHPISRFHFTDEEWQEINDGVFADTISRKIEMHAHAVAEDMLTTVFGAITAANYGDPALTTSAAAFDTDKVAELRQACVEAGWRVRPIDTGLVLNPTFYTSLLKDPAIKDMSASGSDALISGMIPNISGFAGYEAPVLPSNSENLSGFAAKPDAMAIAMRSVDSQDRGDYVVPPTPMTDPESGATMVYSAWHQRNTRKVIHAFESLYGFSKAKGDSIKRIVSA